jgi:Ca2+/Na+ antiporter
LPVALEFGFALAVVLGAAVLFTNAVEILGGRLKLGQGAVGSVLAAVGTALPESANPPCTRTTEGWDPSCGSVLMAFSFRTRFSSGASTFHWIHGAIIRNPLE